MSKQRKTTKAQDRISLRAYMKEKGIDLGQYRNAYVLARFRGIIKTRSEWGKEPEIKE